MMNERECEVLTRWMSVSAHGMGMWLDMDRRMSVGVVVGVAVTE